MFIQFRNIKNLHITKDYVFRKVNGNPDLNSWTNFEDEYNLALKLYKR